MNKHERAVEMLRDEANAIASVLQRPHGETLEKEWRTDAAAFTYALRVLEAVEGVTHRLFSDLCDFALDDEADPVRQAANILQAILDAKADDG